MTEQITGGEQLPLSSAEPEPSADSPSGSINWGDVVSRFYGPVFGIALRLLKNEQDALDAAQEAFFRAMRAADMVDQSRPMFPWLARIASNVCIDWLRRRGLLHFDSAEKLTQVKSDGLSPDQMVCASADAEKLRECTDRLSDLYRTVIVLKYQAGLSNEEISRTLKISREALRVRLFRGKQQLRVLFNEGKV